MHASPRRGHALRFSENQDFDFEIRTVIGLSAEGAAEIGEVLAAVAGVRNGDHRAWFEAWRDLGARTAATAREAALSGHSTSAAYAHLRASNYLGTAVNALSALPDSAALAETFHAQQESWESFIALSGTDAERIGIPFEGGELPGRLFRAAGARPRPLLIAVNGSDGSSAALWAVCTAPALRRGYDVLMFDGPGQQSQLYEAGVGFRPDWERVLTPVYDFAAQQGGVDPERIAVYGISQGGYWVARALAFEHRFAAAILDPGVVDVAASWEHHLPHSLLKLLEAGKDAEFDREMALGMKLSPDAAHTWRFRARPYGTTGYAETIRAVRRYAVADLAQRITTPMLITSPEGEQFWPGQSERLAELAPGVSTVVPFTAAEGADGHCQPLARGLTAQRMFDWLDGRIG